MGHGVFLGQCPVGWSVCDTLQVLEVEVPRERGKVRVGFRIEVEVEKPKDRHLEVLGEDLLEFQFVFEVYCHVVDHVEGEE